MYSTVMDLKALVALLKDSGYLPKELDAIMSLLQDDGLWRDSAHEVIVIASGINAYTVFRKMEAPPLRVRRIFRLPGKGDV